MSSDSTGLKGDDIILNMLILENFCIISQNLF